MDHGILDRINEKGVTGIWRCRQCKAEGTFAQLRQVKCSNPQPVTVEEFIEVISGVSSKRDDEE